MVKVVIDGTNIGSERDVHRILAEALDFGPYYGWNLDALWDRLTTDVERPVEIQWINAAASRVTLGADLFDRLRTLLRKVESRDDVAGRVGQFHVEITE